MLIHRQAALLALPLAAIAGSAMAQPALMHADGWVGENGRILAPAESPAAGAAIRPATRADWLGECNNRLTAANVHQPSTIGYDGACRAWLEYFEKTGRTRDGYGFAYAIPVSISEKRTEVLITAPCNCAPRRPRPAAPRKPVPDKRIRL